MIQKIVFDTAPHVAVTCLCSLFSYKMSGVTLNVPSVERNIFSLARALVGSTPLV